jgi:hypothetical protein
MLSKINNLIHAGELAAIYPGKACALVRAAAEIEFDERLGRLSLALAQIHRRQILLAHGTKCILVSYCVHIFAFLRALDSRANSFARSLFLSVQRRI